MTPRQEWPCSELGDMSVSVDVDGLLEWHRGQQQDTS